MRRPEYRNNRGPGRLLAAMRAIGVTEFGGPEALHVVELPDPQAGPGEVRIRVHAAAVNPTDTGLRSGARAASLKDVPSPYVPGMDVAGVVDQIGPQTATDLRLGDHVMAIVLPHGPHGGYSELIAVPAESVVRVPAGASDAEAATLPMNGLTTVQALDLLGLQPGQVLAVTGAAGRGRRRRGAAGTGGRPAGHRRRVAAGRAARQGPGRRHRGAARAGVRRPGPRGGSRGGGRARSTPPCWTSSPCPGRARRWPHRHRARLPRRRPARYHLPSGERPELCSASRPSWTGCGSRSRPAR